MRLPTGKLNQEEPISNIKWCQSYNVKGNCIYDEYSNTIEIVNKERYRVDFNNLMSGKECYKQIRRRYINNTNFKLISVIIEGYESNIGINIKGINQGDYRLNKKNFKKLLSLYNVAIIWDRIEGDTQ